MRVCVYRDVGAWVHRPACVCGFGQHAACAGLRGDAWHHHRGSRTRSSTCTTVVFVREALVITRHACCRVQPLPSVQSYGSIVFPSLEAGVAALRTIAAQRAAPASIRLVDNAQFMFGRAMKPESASPLRDAWFDRAAKALLSVRPTPRPCLARRVDSHCAVLMVTAQGHAPGPCSGSHAGV